MSTQQKSRDEAYYCSRTCWQKAKPCSRCLMQRERINPSHEKHRCHACVGKTDSQGNPTPPCGLCLAQREKLRNDKLLADGKPTLHHNPFAGITLPTK